MQTGHLATDKIYKNEREGVNRALIKVHLLVLIQRN
jgi:hypothetical protein